MYYSSNGAYRKTKMVIDIINIIATIVIVFLFVGVLFFRSNSGIMFPLIFLLGALINGLAAAKSFMGDNKMIGGILMGVCVVLIILGAFSWRIVTR